MNPEKEKSLRQLGKLLLQQDYEFTTVSPETHRRVLARGGRGVTLRDIFGWNKEFLPSVLAAPLWQSIEGAGEISRQGDVYRSGVRASTLGGQLFLHSHFPTSDEHAVFFGPDSYRFVRLIVQSLKDADVSLIKSAADIGCGSGVGGLATRRILGDAVEIILSDINERALDFTRVNCAINEVGNVTFARADVLQGLPDAFDLIIANPPYLVDASQRLYRHGGGALGFDLSLRIVAESIEHLTSGGRLVLYTGSPIIEGRDLLCDALKPILASPNLCSNYSEIDPDVFGTELEAPPYHFADRIAVVALQLIKR